MTERTVERTDLCRSVPFTTRNADELNDGFTLDGYAAVFNTPTRIDSWEGCFDETLAPGAFKKSLRERTPRMQFDHGHHPLIGSIPIGRFETVQEDSHGLHVVGRLSDNWLIEPVRQAIADGAIDGMSFRFSVIREEWRDKSGKLIKDEDELYQAIYAGSRDEADIVTRTLKEVRITEAGPVVWPAYEATSVGVRSNSLVVDLGSRQSLARAAFVIDAAVRNTDRVNDETVVDDAPRTTEVEAARHVQSPDTSPEAGEHSSSETISRHRAAQIRAKFAAGVGMVDVTSLMNGDGPDGR